MLRACSSECGPRTSSSITWSCKKCRLLGPSPGLLTQRVAFIKQVVHVISLGVGLREAQLSASAHGTSSLVRQGEKRPERWVGTTRILLPKYFHMEGLNWDPIFVYSLLSFEVTFICHAMYMLTYSLSFNKCIY